MTALVGIIGRKFLPGIGDSFPGLFPPSKRQSDREPRPEEKRRAGVNGVSLSWNVARVDAAGAAMGSAGLLGLAFTVYQTLARHSHGRSLTPRV